MRSRFLAAVLSVCCVRAAASQVDAALIPGDRDASAQVDRIVAAAEAAGLPTNAIVGKVRYGVAVAHANPQRIVAAATTVASRLQVARDALAPNPTHPEIEAGAAALGENATPDALRRVRRAGGSMPVTTALGVLTQLLASQVSLDRATAIVTDLVRRGASPAQLTAFVSDFNADVANGTRAQAAIDLRARGLIAVLAAPGGTALTAGALVGGGSPPAPPKPPKRP